MMSLRQRLNRGLVIILTVVFVGHWLAADWVIRSVAEKQMMTRLQHDGDSLLDSMQLNIDAELVFETTHAGSVYGIAYSGHYFVIDIDGRRYTSASLQGEDLPFAEQPVNSIERFHFPGGPKGQPLLVLSRGVERLGHRVSISVAEDLTDIGYDINQIRAAYLVLTAMVLLAAICLQSGDVRRALKPLIAVRDELGEIAHGRQQQIDVKVPTEIKPLVKEVNRLLSLVERRLYQSRTAIGNLAHALKTPLAVLFRLAEHPAFDDHLELRQQLQQQTQTIHQRIERELKRARISGNIQSGSTLNPRSELMALAMLLQNIYTEKNLLIQVFAPDYLINFDREDLLELAGNLLDNACKWAKMKVVVTVTDTYGMRIQVEDDGPGCPEEEMQQLCQRGVRLDEAVQGHGLGLAIVRDIAEFYKGALIIERSAMLGGLSVAVEFPVAKLAAKV